MIKLVGLTVGVWLALLLISRIYYSPSPTLQCANMCLPMKGKYTERYDIANSMEYKLFKYCICE